MMRIDTLEETLRSIGVEPESVSIIVETGEPVYEVTTRDGRYFVKLLSDEKGDVMRSILNRRLAVEMPESRLVREEQYILIMHPASGRPLSLGLPICLLPGLWWRFSDSLVKSTRRVGAGLGELHQNTRQGTYKADDEEIRMASRLSLGTSVREQFDETTVATIEALFDEMRGTHLPCTIVHGDPTPHNIFWDVGTGGADVIDFNLHTSVALEELVVFESGIELMVDRLPYGRDDQRNAIVEAFRSGYAESGVYESLPQRTLGALKITYYVHLLEKYLDPTPLRTRRERMTMYIDKRIIEKKVRGLVADFRDAS